MKKTIKTIDIPYYKKVKVLKAHCPICNEQLKGDNSAILPYICSCGEWRYNVVTFKFDITKEEKKDEPRKKSQS